MNRVAIHFATSAVALMGSVAVIVVLACGGAAAPPPPPAAAGAPTPAGCGKDADCKGDRVCSQGQCVTPR